MVLNLAAVCVSSLCCLLWWGFRPWADRPLRARKIPAGTSTSTTRRFCRSVFRTLILSLLFRTWLWKNMIGSRGKEDYDCS